MCACVAVQVHVPALVLPINREHRAGRYRTVSEVNVKTWPPRLGSAGSQSYASKCHSSLVAQCGEMHRATTLSPCGVVYGGGRDPCAHCLSAQDQPQPGLTMTSEHRPAPCQRVGDPATLVPTTKGADHWQRDTTPRPRSFH